MTALICLLLKRISDITRERDHYRAEAYDQRLAAADATRRLAELQRNVVMAGPGPWGQA